MRPIRNKSVAVVGGAGFLGSHLVDHLIEDRLCQVLVIDNLVSGRKDFIHPQATFAHADVCGSEDYLRRLFDTNGVEYVLNYSAWPYVPDSFVRPLHVFDVNAFGALKVINAASESGCEGILQISSAEIYGQIEPGHDGIDENAPVVPHSTYGAAKAAIDAMVQVRWRESRTPVISLRQFNCLGERDVLHPYIVPEVVRQLDKQKGKIAKLKLGNDTFRDFLYAGDQARMAVELLEKGTFGEVYNLGSQEGIKIYKLAEMIGYLMGFEKTEIEKDPSRVRPWDIWFLKSCNKKIYSVIDARPEVSFEEALRRTIEYLRSVDFQLAWGQ